MVHDDLPDLREELLSMALDHVDKLEGDLWPHQHAVGILKVTLEEVEIGLACPLEDRAAVDAVFGRGRWRRLPRHLVFQAEKNTRSMTRRQADRMHLLFARRR